jgi:hypothetical protein
MVVPDDEKLEDAKCVKIRPVQKEENTQNVTENNI